MLPIDIHSSHTMPTAALTRGIQRDRTSKQPWTQSARPTSRFGICPGRNTLSMADSRNPNPIVLDEQPGMSTARQALPHPEATEVSQLTGGALIHQISPLVVPNLPQLVPTILIPDLTGLITRCSQDPVCGGTYGNIYKCIYHGPDGDVEVRADFTAFPCSVTHLSLTGRCQGNSATIHQ
jgi:hypothetical protein